MATSHQQNFAGPLRRFAVASVLLVAAYSGVLMALFRFCRGDDLFSYILIVPLIAGTLAVRRRDELDFRFVPAREIAAALGIAAALLLTLGWRAGGPLGDPATGALSWAVLSFASAWIAVAFWTLGRGFMAGLGFPASFLLFLTPLPPDAVEAFERALQHASAEAAAWLFPLADIPFFRTGLSFHLPPNPLQGAPECSGIRSTLVLVITSLIVGHLFLRRPWQRFALAAVVIPLGIVRNAFRIVVIGWLCTHHGPEMIHSPIHHRGGPVFFAISLAPLFAMMWLFRRLGKMSKAADPPQGKAVSD